MPDLNAVHVSSSTCIVYDVILLAATSNIYNNK